MDWTFFSEWVVLEELGLSSGLGVPVLGSYAVRVHAVLTIRNGRALGASCR